MLYLSNGGMTIHLKSDLLLRLRRERAWTQEQAAEKIGIDVRTYRRYERSEVGLTNRTGQFEIIRCIAAAFDLPGPEALFDETGVLVSDAGRLTHEVALPVPAEPQGPLDPFAVVKIQITARYLEHIERCVRKPPTALLITDVTGLATGFSCWLSSNPIYQSVISANSRCQASLRRAYGNKVVGVRRTFFVDPNRLDDGAIDRLAATLCLHLSLGIQAAVIYTGPRVPEEVVADLCVFGHESAVDFGHFERLDIMDTGPNGRFVAQAEAYFSDIYDRVQWSLSPVNVDHILVTHSEDVRDLVSDLRARCGFARGPGARDA